MISRGDRVIVGAMRQVGRPTNNPMRFQYCLRSLLLIATILSASFATWRWWVSVPIRTAHTFLNELVDPNADAWTRLVQQHPDSGWSTDNSPTIDYVELRKRSISQKLRGTAEYLVTVKDSQTSNPHWLNFSVSVERFCIAKAKLEDHPNLPMRGNGFR